MADKQYTGIENGWGALVDGAYTVLRNNYPGGNSWGKPRQAVKVDPTDDAHKTTHEPPPNQSDDNGR